MYRHLRNQISNFFCHWQSQLLSWNKIRKLHMCVFSNWKLNLISMKISTRFCVYVVKHVANWFACRTNTGGSLLEWNTVDRFLCSKEENLVPRRLALCPLKTKGHFGIDSKALLVLLQPVMPVALKSKKPRGQERRLSRPVAWVL